MFDIKKQYIWSQIKVGIVITTALMILFIIIFFAGNLESLFLPKIDIKTRIRNTQGLRQGSPVWISGIEIGSVKSINLHPEYGTMVTMSIKKDVFKYLRKDSTATILTMGLLGDKYVELTVGSKSSGQLNKKDIIEGRTQPEIMELTGNTSMLIERIVNFSDKLDYILNKIESGQGSIGKFLNDPSFHNSLVDSTKTLSRLFDKVNQILLKIESGQGSMGKFLNDSSIYDNLNDSAKTLSKMIKEIDIQNGSLKMLVKDPSIYNNLNSASKKLNDLLEKIDSGEGVAASLLKDKQLAQDLKDTISEFKSMLSDMKANPKKYFKFSVF